jgi:fimbrial isopeptide formation D2 family protein
LWHAKDPNALYGPDGDLLPGQLVTYTITYENMGEGRAYGVYVTDELDNSFDFDSVTIDPTTTVILPASRMLVWNVGELAPKGESGSTGTLTFTVRLKNGLPSGTVVSNQATVYFPSVPEETPTNAVVNMIQPVAAIPQSVATLSGQPIAITLSGREASGNPLTYILVDPPLHGALDGSAPNLTYTPAPNFNGSDVFTFKVSNAINHSRAAEVFIAINPDPSDATPPQVLWTTPTNGSVDTPLNPSPIFTGTNGALYEPVIVIGVSEALSATTVTTATVTLEDESGHMIPAEVTYYGNFNQVFLTPRQALKAGTTYLVRITRGVEDLIGNPLAADYVFSFRMANTGWFVYLPVIRR